MSEKNYGSDDLNSYDNCKHFSQSSRGCPGDWLFVFTMAHNNILRDALGSLLGMDNCILPLVRMDRRCLLLCPLQHCISNWPRGIQLNHLSSKHPHVQSA